MGDLQLLGQVRDHTVRHVQRIGQEHPQIPHGRQQKREPEPVVRAAPIRDQCLVRVIEEE